MFGYPNLHGMNTMNTMGTLGNSIFFKFKFVDNINFVIQVICPWLELCQCMQLYHQFRYHVMGKRSIFSIWTKNKIIYVRLQVKSSQPVKWHANVRKF